MTSKLSLKEARKKLRFSFRYVARQTGMAAGTIFNAENELHEIGANKYARLMSFYETEMTKRGIK